MFAPTATIPPGIPRATGATPTSSINAAGIVAVGANIGPGGGVEVIVRGGYRLRRGAGPCRRQSIAVRIVGIPTALGRTMSARYPIEQIVAEGPGFGGVPGVADPRDSRGVIDRVPI